MAMTFGWILIVPPFIAMYNTAKHVQAMETRLDVTQSVEPVLALLLMFVFSVGNGAYLQDHLNRGWDAAAGRTPEPATPPVVPVVTG